MFTYIHSLDFIPHWSRLCSQKSENKIYHQMSQLEKQQFVHAPAFNNVSTFKNLSCVALHAISVFDKV